MAGRLIEVGKPMWVHWDDRYVLRGGPEFLKFYNCHLEMIK